MTTKRAQERPEEFVLFQRLLLHVYILAHVYACMWRPLAGLGVFILVHRFLFCFFFLFVFLRQGFSL